MPSENPSLIVRKKYLSKATGIPCVFDIWKTNKIFFVIAYGTATYLVIRCNTELEAIIELKQWIDKASVTLGNLETAKELKNVGLLKKKNPIWKLIGKTKKRLLSIP